MSKRAAIIQLHRVGHSNSKIMKLLKAPKSTVHDTICALPRTWNHGGSG